MRSLIIVISLFFSFSGYAQESDSIATFRTFLQVCNSYKELPLQLTLNYKRVSNINYYDADTATIQASFHVLKEGAYIRFGNLEQIVTDSLVLMVMDDAKQMVISPNTFGLAQLTAMTGASFADTSILNVVKRYTVNTKELSKDRSVIEILNRINVAGSGISIETIELTYDNKKNVPEKVVTVKRSLFPKSKAGPITNSTLIRSITIPGEGDFFIKEDSAIYLYSKIGHDRDVKLPITLQDRITKNEEEVFIPVKAYENYSIINN